MKVLAGLLLLARMAVSQQLDLSVLDRLSSVARETANVNLDKSTLQAGAQLLSNMRPAEQKVKGLTDSLDGVYVRTFEFEKAGEFTQADLEPIRKQLRGAKQWANIVNVKDKNESVEVWMFNKASGGPGGLTVIAAEAKELVVVNIVGPVNIGSLAAIAGQLGIPELGDIIGSKKPSDRSDKGRNEDE